MEFIAQKSVGASLRFTAARHPNMKMIFVVREKSA